MKVYMLTVQADDGCERRGGRRLMRATLDTAAWRRVTCDTPPDVERGPKEPGGHVTPVFLPYLVVHGRARAL